MADSALPTISVITPSFNQGRFIRQNIESVLAQGGSGWEHIIVDGGSDDDTVSILKEYPHLKWVSERDEGQADALNKAMAISEGDLIFWINSDDLVAAGAFQAARHYFSANPRAAIVCGNAVVVDADGRELRRMGPRVRADQLRRPWNGSTSMHQPSIVFRRGVFEAVGPFNYDLNMAMDYDFFLRATRQFELYHLSVDLGLFREYPGTKTGEGAGEAFKEVRRALTRHVRDSGGGSAAWASIRGFLAQGNAWANDAAALYKNGSTSQARLCLVRALCHNPLSPFKGQHLHYRSRKLLGQRGYNFLRAIIKSKLG